MTCFNDRETPYPCLEIAASKSDSHVKALILKVHPPMIGFFPLVRKSLETSLHLTEWSMMETKDVMDNFSGKIVLLRALLAAMGSLAVGVSLPPSLGSAAPKSLIPLNGVVIDRATSSSNKSNASQEPHWKRLKKKHKDLSDQHHEFADLDSISIDTAIFEDGATGLTMPLADLAH
ncbi:hypothetical protein T459_17623 [Capsicum annuum]|uniref:Uncharacterized protein n=1 Tax=Capsicum annuum TaxID=4072 RepID=A0A2G2ZCD4_CAPAN|nr:hypothetical protein T459_17623 [Capsicum annuum]